MTTHEPLARDARYRLRIADYLTLAEAGAFADLRTELVEGEIVLLSPQYRPHGRIKLGLYDRLRDALRDLGSPLSPVVELSLEVDEHTMVDPDLLLTSEPIGEGPVPLASVALAIEVADSTLAKDLGVKASLYAAAAVPEYWVADVNARVLHQMWDPMGNAYAGRRATPFGVRTDAATIAGLSIAMSDL